MKEFYVKIIEHKTRKTIKQMGPYTEHKADKIDDGININLNHEEFYTQIVIK